MGDGATDGAAVAHLRVSDLAGHMGEQRRVTLQHIADLKVAVAGQGPDGDVAAVLPDIGQLGQPADVDQHGGRRQAQLHERQQRVAAGQQLGVLSVPGQPADGIVDGRRPLVVEGRGDHECTSSRAPAARMA